MQPSDPAQNGVERLDSWKAIAAYLQRDERTVRRWELELGLPIRRVENKPGASVYAFRAEIDAWLSREQSAGRPGPSASRAAKSRPRLVLLAVGAIIVAGITAAAGWWFDRDVDVSALRIDVSPTAITARDPRGRERWRHAFPADRTTALLPSIQPSFAVGGEPPYLLTGFGAVTRHQDATIESGSLLAFSADGRLLRSFRFEDEVTFDHKRFGPPWGLTSFEAERTAPHRIAVAGHHYVWDPGIVTLLDADWHRRGTFVHPGWIEFVHWLSANSLLIGGYSNARNGGMMAILDPAELDGQAPEPPGSPYRCETCGTSTPVRMIILPKSEVNRAAAAPFNHAVIQVAGNRLIARSIEVASEQGPADAIYEFTPTLDLIAATFSERYWDMHRALEAQGKIDHAAAACPDKAGPAAIETWDRLHGWQTLAVQRPR